MPYPLSSTNADGFCAFRVVCIIQIVVVAAQKYHRSTHVYEWYNIRIYWKLKIPALLGFIRFQWMGDDFDTLPLLYVYIYILLAFKMGLFEKKKHIFSSSFFFFFFRCCFLFVSSYYQLQKTSDEWKSDTIFNRKTIEASNF